MIYVASLSRPVKKAMGSKAQLSTVNKIIERMSMDPEVGLMDVVLLGPQDAIGPNKEKLNTALANRHRDICTIYLYSKDNEKGLLECEYSFKAKKFVPTVIKEVIEDNVGAHKIKTGKLKVSTADFEDPHDEENNIAKSIYNAVGSESIEPVTDIAEHNEPATESDDEQSFIDPDNFLSPPIPEEKPRVDLVTDYVVPDVEDPMPQIPLDTAAMEPEPVKASDAVFKNNFIEDVKNVANFEIFKEMLNKNAIMNSIIHENSDYVATMSLLDALEQRIEEIFRDPTMDSTEKFEKIRDIGLNRSILQASQNSISTERVINIITAIADSAKNIVDEKIKSIDDMVCKIAIDRANMLSSVQIEKAIDARTETYVELLNLGRNLVDLYNSIDSLVNDTINDFDAKLPSKDAFINQMMKPAGPNIFTPTNSAELANALMQLLASKRISFSQLEDHLRTTCDLIGKYMEQSNDIIMYQKQQLDLLKANRVEDVIIAPTALKRVLKLYVGADNCGRSATAITWNGVLSRRQNTLLIDLTGRDKFEHYGIESISLDSFMAEKVEKQFCCVASDHILDSIELKALIDEMSLWLNYYSNVGVILAPEDTEGLNFLSEEALSVHYITDCRTAGMDELRTIIQQHTTPNIAHVLITIDAPISPVSIADDLRLDLSRLKIVSIPNMQQIRACAIRKQRPFDFTDVVKVFEGGFNL